MKTQITRKIEFDAGHRVLGHEGKCANIHGHRYVALITVEGGLDNIGRVIDFSVVKEIVGKWIDDNWDHNLLLHEKDPVAEFYEDMDYAKVQEFFGPKTPFLMECNPTAENMSAYLLKLANEILPANITVTNVRIYETPNCWSDTSV